MTDPLDQFISPSQKVAIRAPIGEALTLPRKAFLSEEFFRLEVERLFSRTWMGVGFSHSVANSGDVLPLTLLGMPLLLIRDEDEVLRIFHNIGAHDACPVQLEPGTGQKELVSPYHGWRYDLRGQLIATPFWDGTPDPSVQSLGRREVNLREVPSAVWCGTIYVNISGDAQPFEEYIAPVLALFRDRDLSGLGVTVDSTGEPFTASYPYAGNWKTYMENTCINVLHEGFVHQLYRDSPDVPRVTKDGEKTYTDRVDRGLLALHFDSKDADETYPELGLAPIRLSNGEIPSDRAFVALFPNTNITLFPDMVQMTIARPLDAGRTDVLETNFLNGEAAFAPEFAEIREELYAINRMVVSEDEQMVDAVQLARQSPAYDQVFYSPFWDTLHYEFNKMVLDALESE